MTRVKPSMGDALVVNYFERDIGSGCVAVIASCECLRATYTAVSGSSKSARKLIYRKHVKHLPACNRQAELFSYDSENGDGS